MESKAVSDTGPLLHLSEIHLFKALEIFSQIQIPVEVESELRKYKVVLPRGIKVTEIHKESKDRVKILVNQNELDLGEACAIALALQEKTDVFLTDDLDARTVAKSYNLEVHGTLGILLRAFRENVIDKTEAEKKIRELHQESTLFITTDLLHQALEAIEQFSRKK